MILGVLIDGFGQARLADPCVLANGPSKLRGTIPWMAPELLENPTVKATFATDVDSVGITFVVFLFHLQLVSTLF